MRLTSALIALAASGCAVVPNPSPYTVTRNLPYIEGGTDRQAGDLYQPEGDGLWPAVLVIHGGGWSGGERSDMDKFGKRLAQAGYVVYNVGYRLAPDDRFPAQLNDVRNALRWLQDNAQRWNVNPTRIATLGYSAGAHLALMLGLTPSDGLTPVAAIVAGGNPTDLRVYPKSPYIFDLIGGAPSEFPDEYAFASPITHISADNPPVFLYHGRLDRLVEFDQSQRMHDALQTAGVPVTLYPQPLSGHITTFLFDRDTMRKVVPFLNRTIGPGADRQTRE